MADVGEDARGVATLPTGGLVYDSTSQYKAQPKLTFQHNIQDPVGATLGNSEGRLPTFSCATVAYAPFANASDILVIIGSATNIIRIRRIAVSGRATGASNIDVALFKRFILNTGGAPTALIPVLHDTVINPAPTAVVQTYGSAPTISAGTGASIFRCQQSNLSAAGSGGAAIPVEFDFGQMGGQSAVLRSATESITINLGSVTIPTGTVLNLWLEWTEE